MSIYIQTKIYIYIYIYREILILLLLLLLYTFLGSTWFLMRLMQAEHICFSLYRLMSAHLFQPLQAHVGVSTEFFRGLQFASWFWALTFIVATVAALSFYVIRGNEQRSTCFL